MLGRVIGISTLVSAFVLAILLMTTTPATIGPLGILIVFILMYMSALGVLTFLLYIGSKVAARFSASFTVRRPLQAMSLSRSYYFSSVIALVPVMLIGMQSVGEVGFYEVMLLIVFIIVACIYLAKRTS